MVTTAAVYHPTRPPAGSTTQPTSFVCYAAAATAAAVFIRSTWEYTCSNSGRKLTFTATAVVKNSSSEALLYRSSDCCTVVRKYLLLRMIYLLHTIYSVYSRLYILDQFL